MSLFQEACRTELGSRFIARADDLNRDMTDEETIEEIEYQLHDLPYKGLYDEQEQKAIAHQLKKLLITAGRLKKRI